MDIDVEGCKPYLGLLHATPLTGFPNSLVPDGSMILYITGPLGDSTKRLRLLGRLPHQRGLTPVLDWKGRQTRHGDGAKQEPGAEMRQQELGCDAGVSSISRKARLPQRQGQSELEWC